MQPPIALYIISESTITPGGLGVVALGRDIRRVSILFDSPAGAGVYISTRAGAGVGEGIFLTPSKPPVKITYSDYGDLVYEPWYVSTTDGTAALTIITVTAKGSE